MAIITLTTDFGTSDEDAARGELFAYIGSAGTVEIAVRDGRADKRLGLLRGTSVVPMPTDPAASPGPYR